MTAWRPVADALLAALIAPSCAACGQVLDRPLDGSVCDACWRAVIPLTPPLCRACGDPLPSWRVASLQEGLCPRCRRQTLVIVRGRAVGGYDGVLCDIIHALKYGARRSIAPRLAALMADHGREVLAGADAVVPVPLHQDREHERGFNQADDLAQGLGLPVRRWLRRVRPTRPQVELPAAQRHRNVEAAFVLADRYPGRWPRTAIGRRSVGLSMGNHRTSDGPAGKILVLVDDVTTTGATLEACARVLHAGGAAEVRALTAARVVSQPPRQRPP